MIKENTLSSKGNREPGSHFLSTMSKDKENRSLPTDFTKWVICVISYVCVQAFRDMYRKRITVEKGRNIDPLLK